MVNTAETLPLRFEAQVLALSLVDFFLEGGGSNNLRLHCLTVIWLVQGFLNQTCQPGYRPNWLSRPCYPAIPTGYSTLAPMPS